MKSFVLACAVSACCIAPHIAESAPSFHTYNLAEYKSYSNFCEQSIEDHLATHQELTPALAKLCL